MTIRLSVSIATEGRAGQQLLAPLGLPTPHHSPLGLAVENADFSLTGETRTGQMAALITASDGQEVTLHYRFAEGGPGYPDSPFVHRPNRFTQAAEALAEEARDLAAGGGLEGIVNAVAEKFTYGHPDRSFHEQQDSVPALCGLTEGSCVDINTYLVASLRAAGFEAGYVTGYFFPAEKAGRCDDMHCWVVTREAGQTREWDIAHHLKMGESQISPALNPKPGRRLALAHSMGLDFPALGLEAVKLIAEPLWLDGGGRLSRAELSIRLEEHSDADAAD